MKLRAFLGGICIATVFLSLGAHAQVSSYLTNIGTGAVDAKGVRHDGNSYPRKHPPWLDDRVKTVAPDYPYAERARHHQGAGWYRLELDLKTGIVAQVIIAKSTGFSELDQCAVSAFR